MLKPPRGTQLNRSHPLARGLVGCWLMNEGSGTQLLDLANYKKDSCVAANTLWIPCKFGSALQTDTSTTANRTNLGNDFRSDFGSSPFTIVVGLTPLRKSSAKDISAVGRWKLGTFPAENMWLMGLNYYATGTDYYPFFAFSDGVNYYLADTPQWTVGQYLFLTGVRNGSYMGLYRNGILVNSRTNAGTGAVNNVSACILKLGEIGTGAYNTNVEYHFLYIYKRVLSAAEIRQLYLNPFAMFEGVSVGKLLHTPPAETWLAGSAGAQSATSAALRGLRCIAGSAAAQSQGSALCKITRKVIATAADTAYLFGILTLSARLPWFTGSLEIERPWLREVLFNCVSANAFKLGTALTGGWFWVRVSGCSALYRGAGMEQIDLTNILAIAAQDAREIRPPSYLLHNSNSTYFYVVRRFNNCGYREYTLRAAVKVSMDAGGAIAKPQPNNVFCSKTEQTDGDKIRLVWFYCPLEQKSKPARFKIYWDGQTGQIDYDNPVATVNYQGRKYYNYETIALEAGRYLFAIRAEDASGIENNSLARSRIDLHTTTPNPVTILSVEAI